MTIADLILNTRALGPDPCQLMGPPALGTITPATTAGAAFPLLSTIYLVSTALNPSGETLPTSEANVALTGTQNSLSIPIAFPPGATALRVYYSASASGAENGYEQFTLPPGQTSPYTVTVLGVPVAGLPPVNPSSYLPDTDGGFASAATMYRWLNESLKAAARVTGGIQDSCGIASVSGQRRYVVPGQWLKITHAFYDGWEQDLGTWPKPSAIAT